MLPALLLMLAASTGELGHVCDKGLRSAEPARPEALGWADSSGEDPGLVTENPSLPAAAWSFSLHLKQSDAQVEPRSCARQGGLSWLSAAC